MALTVYVIALVSGATISAPDTGWSVRHVGTPEGEDARAIALNGTTLHVATERNVLAYNLDPGGAMRAVHSIAFRDELGFWVHFINIDTYRDYVYVTDIDRHLHTMRYSAATGYEYLDMKRNASSLVVHDGYLFVGGGGPYFMNGSLQVYDLVEPSSPILVGYHGFEDPVARVWVAGPVAYVWTVDSWSWDHLVVVDVENPRRPRVLASIPVNARLGGMVTSEEAVFLTTADALLKIARPEFGHLAWSTVDAVEEDTAPFLHGDYLYLAMEERSEPPFYFQTRVRACKVPETGGLECPQSFTVPTGRAYVVFSEVDEKTFLMAAQDLYVIRVDSDYPETVRNRLATGLGMLGGIGAVTVGCFAVNRRNELRKSQA